ncbi:HEPN domain-containing protein [Roseomonas mucosa]|nr:HEPN domain-containing protein [Roseomonas mucosa]MBS5903296.1 hypothetical protein [Acetobacteraceae bacterium]MDT8292178.1 HEPN domain-containing protein [Roseomonas mucosa]MDT8294718.1 HEPN domain-containing protein [Roseomonas mucosa]MDT8349639.1 HEPN domain-containing protein [Roseomonas mucosa]MDT8355736.1 HEPN domain-containing protein [Roseomonas mucosa]
MLAAFNTFQTIMQRARAMHGLHGSLSKQLTSAVDLSDMLRSELVLAVSAFDFFIHEVTRLGMLECYSGRRVRTAAFEKFQVPMALLSSRSETALDIEIRTRHGYKSFQSPVKVAEAIRLISEIDLWQAVAAEIGVDHKEIKRQLNLIVDRRNKIAHEADVDPSYPNQLWPIDPKMVEDVFDLIERIAEKILLIVSR